MVAIGEQIKDEDVNKILRRAMYKANPLLRVKEGDLVSVDHEKKEIHIIGKQQNSLPSASASSPLAIQGEVLQQQKKEIDENDVEEK